MLTKRYMTSLKNLPAIMQKIVEGTAPEKFTISHLKGIGFKSSNDLSVIPLLKDLGFMRSDGAPTKRYHDYRDASRSRTVMAEALREAYSDLFHINEKPGAGDKEAIKGKFVSTHNVTERVADQQTATFYALLKLADLSASPPPASGTVVKKATPEPEKEPPRKLEKPSSSLIVDGLHYSIQIHLPATKDVEVFNAIFKSLKEHLLE
jgi:hypothetical protein